MHRVSSPDRFDTYFGKADLSHIPGLDQIRNRTHRVFNWNRWIQPRRTVDIDVIDAKTRQALRDEIFDGDRSGIYSKPFAAGSPQCSKLDGEDCLVPPAADRSTNEHF